MAELYEKDNYLSTTQAMFNKTIVEYDLKSANTSLAREYGLLPDSKIKEIESMSKRDRVVTIGKIKRDTPGYSDKEKVAFMLARKSFMEQNDLEYEDILAIKRDAIFTLRYVKKESVGKHLLFRKKNEYTSYIHLSPLELYFSSENLLDVKGMDDTVYKERHSEYFGHMLSTVFLKQERGENPLKFLRKAWDDYKWFELPTEFYREFNAQSLYAYKDGLKSIDEYRGDKKELDISYNLNFIARLTSMLLDYN